MILLPGFVLLLFLTACGNKGAGADTVSQTVSEGTGETLSAGSAERDLETENADDTATEDAVSEDAAVSEKGENPVEEKSLNMKIGDTVVTVDWEDNESVSALRELVKDEPLAIDMSMYGGFEQVGNLGTSLPRNDVQITTESGDIVLYSGNQIVVFYGSNSWAYTRLGHITDKTAEEMEQLLGGGDIAITISAECLD